MLAGLIINRKLDFVRLVDRESMEFGFPPVVSRGSCACNNYIFGLNSDECFGGARETTKGRMVDILYSQNTNRKSTAQGFPKGWQVDAVVYNYPKLAKSVLAQAA